MAIGLAAVSIARGSTGGVTYPCDGMTPAEHRGVARGIIRAAFAPKNWRDREPLEADQRSSLAAHTSCSDRPKRIAQFRRHKKEAFHLWRSYRQIATEPGFKGEGKWLRWLVIPRWVVAAETSGYHGAGRWRATNPSSGACGPYQLNGHTSCDTSSARDKLRHHRVAGSLPRGSWEVGY